MSRQRQKIVPLARGKVLEIGFGTGLNLPFYNIDQVSHLWALEPSFDMYRMAKRNITDLSSIEYLHARAQSIPLQKDEVDCIVMTYTLCSIDEADLALSEFRRVLKPGGKLFFCEHGESPDEGIKIWQDRINPLWRKVAGGCCLNKDIPTTLAAGGFLVTRLNAMYIPGWKPLSYNYWGTAVAR